MSPQVKSKQRVADHGEVFTADREVQAMCDLVKQETERIDSRFLEPACGDGNFLAEILKRKLAIVKKKYNYGYGATLTRIKNLEIPLPITSDGKPDWEFMSDYIKTQFQKEGNINA